METFHYILLIWAYQCIDTYVCYLQVGIKYYDCIVLNRENSILQSTNITEEAAKKQYRRYIKRGETKEKRKVARKHCY